MGLEKNIVLSIFSIQLVNLRFNEVFYLCHNVDC